MVIIQWELQVIVFIIDIISQGSTASYISSWCWSRSYSLTSTRQDVVKVFADFLQIPSRMHIKLYSRYPCNVPEIWNSVKHNTDFVFPTRTARAHNRARCVEERGLFLTPMMVIFVLFICERRRGR